MLLFAGIIVGTFVFYGSSFFPISCLGILLFLILSLFAYLPHPISARIRTAVWLVCSCTGGFILAAVSHQSIDDHRLLAGAFLEIKGAPMHDAVLIDQDRNLHAQVFRIDSAIDQSFQKYPLRSMRIISARTFDLAHSYRLHIRMQNDISLCNPAATDKMFTGYLISAEEEGPTRFALFAHMRSILHRFFLEHFAPQNAAFLISIVTGERVYLPRELNQAFGVTGLAHILSISGTHFGLVFFLLFQICRFLILHLPERLLIRLSQVASPSQIGASLAMPALLFYLFLSDMSYPAVRSFIMIMLFLFGLLLGRSGMWLNTLLFAAALIIVFDQDALADLSFQLSFIASLSIGLTTDIISKRHSNNQNFSALSAEKKLYRQRILAWIKNTLVISCGLSLAASMSTAALIAYYFHYLSLITPVTNLFFTPLIGLIILPYALFGSFWYLLTGFFPSPGILDYLTEQTLTAIQTCAALPFITVSIDVFAPIFLILFYGIIFATLWVRVIIPWLSGEMPAFCLTKIALSLIIVLVSAFAWTYVQRLDGVFITFLDVGQGDAAIIELPDKRMMVIDTGRNYYPVTAYLRSRGVQTIDALVLSHAHPDHTAGYMTLVREFAVKEIWDNGRLQYHTPLPKNLIHRSLQRGDVLSTPECRFTILHPYQTYLAENKTTEENNDSLVLKLEAYGKSVLFTGDIAVDAEESLLPLGNILSSTVLKVPHHGSRTSLSASFLHSIKPQFAVISVGRTNRYGHPHPSTLQALSGSTVYRTDRDGAIGILVRRDGSIKVKTCQQERLQRAFTFADEIKNTERLLSVW